MILQLLKLLRVKQQINDLEVRSSELQSGIKNNQSFQLLAELLMNKPNPIECGVNQAPTKRDSLELQPNTVNRPSSIVNSLNQSTEVAKEVINIDKAIPDNNKGKVLSMFEGVVQAIDVEQHVLWLHTGDKLVDLCLSPNEYVGISKGDEVKVIVYHSGNVEIRLINNNTSKVA